MAYLVLATAPRANLDLQDHLAYRCASLNEVLGFSRTLEWEHLIYDWLPAACCKQVEYGQSCRSQYFGARSTVATRAVSNDCLVLRKQRPKLEGWWWSAGLTVDHQSSVKREA